MKSPKTNLTDDIDHASAVAALLLKRCTTPTELHQWVQLFAGINVPRKAVCPNHDAPFQYLLNAYYEPAKDQVVWAPRGGGKTRLAAVATLLDLLHKCGCSVRILGGSLEQSLRMWEHLLPDVQRIAAPLFAERLRGASVRRLTMIGGASAAVLTQSQRAVRGLRVQKLRCDEVELFDPKIWDAAQLVTKSRRGAWAGSGSPGISGSIEALSTAHKPHGLMHRIIEQSKRDGTAVVHWCLLEVLEKCPPERLCATCPLWDDCRGVAKTECEGFVSIDDAIAMKRRVSRETWDAEMLCKRPTTRGCVFPSFDASVHVRESLDLSLASSRPPSSEQTIAAELTLAIDFGFANPFVCLWIVTRPDGVSQVIDEYVQPMRTIDEHIAQIQLRKYGQPARVVCDPAGNSRNDQTAASNVAVLRSAGYVVRHRASHIADGLEMIRAALRPAFGEVRLFIHPRCTRLIRALEAYRYPEGGGELPIKDGEHDHLIDALRYYFVNRSVETKATARRY
jgi:hypothetical protein